MALALAALLLHPAAWADKLAETSKQKRAAEAEHAELLQQLEKLRRDIDRTEDAKNDAASALAQAEAAISKTSRALHELAAKQRTIEAEIARLSKEQKALTDTIREQQTNLATLLREQYVTGNEDRMKLLLSGDNPNRVNRDLQYMGYVSRAQAVLIDSLQQNLRTVESNKQKTQEAHDQLQEVAHEQREQKAELEQEKSRRATLLSTLSSKLASQRKEANTIERDNKRLANLVERLGTLIQNQRRAAAAARERLRREELARARAASEAASRQSGNAEAGEDDESPELASRDELERDKGVQERQFVQGFGQPFSSLRGKLHFPVTGDLLSRYGKRQDGPPAKGVFIGAATGTEVRAVAAGQVVFAEWLRGFGNLLIIDHGDEYMTIYGNNQAVLKHAGDIVKAGDVVAQAGNSGGNEQSGLYFEIRHQGRAFDPLDWMAKNARK